MDQDLTSISQVDSLSRTGGWLPAGETALAAFRTELVTRVRARPADAPLFPVVRNLQTQVNDDPILRMGFTRSIDQALAAGFDLGYSNFEELIASINEVMTYAPPFDTSELVGCPLNALLDWPMCMPAGFALFRSPTLNLGLKQVLQFWCRFLSGPESRAFLNTTSPTGWFCPEAAEKTHLSQFIYDPDQPYGKFTSWNDFFTREFKPGERPVADPNYDKVIVNACESTTYDIQHDVRLEDSFWIKSQPYSLQDIFAPQQRRWAESFVGGSVYQAFLSAYNFHRWRSPVGGTVVEAYLIDGTYYSDVRAEGRDPAGPNDSQGYITAVATRAVIIIQCDDPSMGFVACVFVGMAEISSCVIDRMRGQRVQKGEELGYFQYGGSTHCLIFQQGVIDRFIPTPPFNADASPEQVSSVLAIAN